WSVDAAPTVTRYELSEPLARSGDTYVFNGPFTMRLTGEDDRDGHLVSESRVDGDGGFNYFGWPTSSERPWTFSEEGTVIDHLVYGKLPRGRHTVEYRTIDAAGNHGEPGEFTVTTIAPPPACTRTITGEHRGPLTITSGVTCLDGARVTGPVVVGQGASLVATGGRITGTLSASRAEAVHLLRTRLDGALSADRTARLQIVSAELRGAVRLTGNDAPILSGSTIHGALACSGNTPAPADLGVPNTLRGAGGGQCAALRDGPRGKRYEAVQHLAE